MSNTGENSITSPHEKQIVPFNGPRSRIVSPTSVASYTVDWVSRLPDATCMPEPVHSPPSGYGSVHYGTFPNVPPPVAGYPPHTVAHPPSSWAFASAPPRRAPSRDLEKEKFLKKKLEEEKDVLRKELDEARKQETETYVKGAMERMRQRQKETDDLVFRETERKEELQQITKYWSEHPEAYEKYKNGQ